MSGKYERKSSIRRHQGYGGTRWFENLRGFAFIRGSKFQGLEDKMGAGSAC